MIYFALGVKKIGKCSSSLFFLFDEMNLVGSFFPLFNKIHFYFFVDILSRFDKAKSEKKYFLENTVLFFGVGGKHQYSLSLFTQLI